MADTPATPKMDIKMLILPLVFIFGKKIPWSDPWVVTMVQRGFMSVVAVVLTAYYFVYTKINRGDGQKKIWVPPKPKPTLPFGMGPPPEPIEAKDYEETTYKEHELKVLKEGVTAVGMSVLISGFMSIKMESHQALLIQGLTMPFNFYDNVVAKKYIFGVTKAADGGLLYGELFKAPTAESLKLAASVAEALKDKKEKASSGEDSPRVVELPDDEDDDKTKGNKKEEKASKSPTKASPVNDID